MSPIRNISYQCVVVFVKNAHQKTGQGCSTSLKRSKFCVVWTTRFCSNFTSMWYKHVLRNVWRDFRLSMSALETVAGKSFKGKLLQKLISDRVFYVTITDADSGSLKSLHTLFDKYLDHMLVKF